jgi:broad specificity phosphatase PhoE
MRSTISPIANQQPVTNKPAPMTDTIWLTRHGNRQDFVDPDWAETAARPHDPGLSSDGKEQARKLAGRLREERIEHLFASPFLRAVQTAHFVAEALDLPINLETGLAEWMNVEWFSASPERLSTRQLAERFPRVDRSYEGGAEPSFPETRQETLRRAGRTARRLADACDGPLLIVAHGITISGLTAELDPDVNAPEGALCSLHRFRRNDDDDWHMDVCEDVAHLDESKGGGRLN